MSLFKIFRGPDKDLNKIPPHNGYAYFTEDKGNLYIDTSDEPGSRVQVSAYAAEVLRPADSNDVIEIDEIQLKEDAISFSKKEFTLTKDNWKNNSDKYTYTLSYTDLKCGKNHDIPPMIYCISNHEEFNLIETADATPGTGIIFTTTEAINDSITVAVVDMV